MFADEKWSNKNTVEDPLQIVNRDGFEKNISQFPLGVTIRWVGSAPDLSKSKVLSSPDVAIHQGEITESGRRELMPFFNEQAVSITAHSYGNPLPMLDEVFAKVML